MTNGRWRAVLAAAAVALVGAGCASGPPVARLTDPSAAATFPEPGLGAPPSLAGKPLPSGTFTRLSGGSATFTDLRGRPAIVNLWSRTCTPCVQEMPVFDALHRRLGDAVSVVGLNSGDAPDAAKAFAATLGVSYDLWLDDGQDATRALGVTALPTTIFVDADGAIVRTHLGAFDAAALDDAVNQVFGL